MTVFHSNMPCLHALFTTFLYWIWIQYRILHVILVTIFMHLGMFIPKMDDRNADAHTSFPFLIWQRMFLNTCPQKGMKSLARPFFKRGSRGTENIFVAKFLVHLCK